MRELTKGGSSDLSDHTARRVRVRVDIVTRRHMLWVYLRRV